MSKMIKGPKITLLFLALCLSACSHRIYPTTTTQTKDSVRVEYRERLVRDTAYIEVPREQETIITRDTSSHLENSYAVSDASVQAGMLHHSLETKPQKLAAPVYVQVRDTIYVQTSSDIQKETIVEIRNELTKGQRRQIVGFWILLAAAIAAAAWKIARLFR